MAKARRKTSRKKSTGRKMTVGECRTTKKGVEFCRTSAGVRFTGRMSDMGFDEIGEFAMAPGECKNIRAGGGVRTLCYTAKGPRFVTTRTGIPIADLGAHRARKRR